MLGVPDGQVGEEVGAAVVLKSGREASEDDLREFIEERMAGYKCPRRVWFGEELPKGPTEKILKKDIEVPEAAGTG